MNASTAAQTSPQRAPRALPEPVITRVDFFLFNEKAYTGVDRQCWRVVKYAEGWTAHTPPVDVRVNPTLKTANGEEPFDIDRALALLERAGWQVRRWRGGARAWKGEMLPVRDRAAILRLRARAERELLDLNPDGLPWRADFALDF
jgi:hypothetical protein